MYRGTETEEGDDEDPSLMVMPKGWLPVWEKKELTPTDAA